MIKKYLKYIFILILAIIFLYAFYASYASHNIDNLAHVIAIGIDTSDNTDKYKITFQFTEFSAASQNSSSDEPSTFENTVEASSIDNAINLMTAYIGKELNLSHCKIIIFSEEVAKKGISTQIYSFINNEEIRPSTNIIISKCDAKEYISNSQPVFDKLASKYYESFFLSSSFTGFTDDLTIGEFYNKLVCSTCNPIAILGYDDPGYANISSTKSQGSSGSSQDSSGKSQSSSEGTQDSSGKSQSSSEGSQDSSGKSQSSSEGSQDSSGKSQGSSGESQESESNKISKNFGMAVFSNDTLIGELTPLETLSYMLINNNIDSFVISIQNPTSRDSYIDLSMTQSNKTKVKVDIINGSPYISLDLFVSGKILTLDEGSDYTKNSILNSVQESCNSYLEDLIYSYLYKSSKEYKTDINGFGKFALKSFLTNDEWKKYNWHAKYKDASFKVNVHSNIDSTMLLTNS